MRFKNTDKGVAGLTILLSVVTMLFVMGLLIMIFALMGGELQEASYDSTSVTVVNETGAYVNISGYTVDESGTLNGVYTATEVWANAIPGAGVGTPYVILAANYTLSAGGVLTNATVVDNSTEYDNANISYTYVYDATNTATDVIGNTTTAIATVTDWFDIFIVITAMVVLILLTVIIIVAIRGSGLMEGSA